LALFSQMFLIERSINYNSNSLNRNDQPAINLVVN